MIHFGLAGQIAAQTHGDGASCDFGQSCDPDQVQVILPDGAAETGRQRERNRKAIGHADDDIGQDFRTPHVLFDVSVCSR